jgi:hypothetical protein
MAMVRCGAAIGYILRPTFPGQRNHSPRERREGRKKGAPHKKLTLHLPAELRIPRHVISRVVRAADRRARRLRLTMTRYPELRYSERRSRDQRASRVTRDPGSVPSRAWIVSDADYARSYRITGSIV